MSQPATKERTRGTRVQPTRTRYEDDLYTWVQEQVALLRAGRFDEVDAENVAEELSDVGKSEFRELQSALALILTHMLKWDYQPERRSRSWANSIAAQRRHQANVFKDNPGLKSRRTEALERAYELACIAASTQTNRDISSFPATCPYSWDDMIERPFTFEPQPSASRRP